MKSQTTTTQNIVRVQTRLTQLLGIELPLIQAPMAGVQGSALAIAVSEAGGLGSLPCAAIDGKTMRTELKKITTETTRPFNVNFFCHTPPIANEERETAWRVALQPYYQEFELDLGSISAGPSRFPFSLESVSALSEFRPPVVSFHFGLPAIDLLASVKSWGAKVLSSATTVAEARWLEANGADAIIAQGLEAGGHRGMFLSDDLNLQTSTCALVARVVEAVTIPVVAAGGIADARAVMAALALGAAGVQIGTAYLLCPEADTSPVHRAALNGPEASKTAVTNLFTGRPARGIMNRLMRELGPMSRVAPPFPLASAALTPLRAAAEKKGSGDFSPLWAGENTRGCTEMSAADLTRSFFAVPRVAL